MKPRTMGWTNAEDIFGDVDGLIREQRGWLTEEVRHECIIFLQPFPLTFPVEGQSFPARQTRTSGDVGLYRNIIT